MPNDWPTSEYINDRSVPPTFVKPTNRMFYNNIELGAIWELEITDDDHLSSRSKAWEEHGRINRFGWDFQVGGIDDKKAMDMLIRATRGDHDLLVLTDEQFHRALQSMEDDGA